MSGTERGTYSAAPSAIGYFYQVRFALLESLKRVRKGDEFTVCIETLDDVVFETSGDALEVFQTKHHITRAANLSDASPVLWKTLRIWCEALAAGRIPHGSVLFLVTTASASPGHATSYLKSDAARNTKTAFERLNSTATSSTSEENKASYAAYRALDQNTRQSFLDSVYILDLAHRIDLLDGEIRDLLFFAVDQRFLSSFSDRLEGWWFRRVLNHLLEAQPQPILGEEVNAEISRIREQFKQDNLPIDDDVMTASVDATGYQDRLFVEQLRLIEIGNSRIFHAIRNYFRAFEQRSRWIREDLVLVGELGRYEDRLIEEWEIMFQQMIDDLGPAATDGNKKQAAQALYKWVETNSHPGVRAGVTEAFVSRGTYQILAENQRVGWHCEFKERLEALLESRGQR